MEVSHNIEVNRSAEVNTVEVVILLLGSLISIILSVYLANQFGTPYQYIIGLLSEIIVLLVSVFWHFRTRLDKLSAEISNYSILVKASDRVRNVDDPAFRQKYIEVRQLLVNISNGYYSIPTLAGVYDDDIYTIDNLKTGEILYSMCPVGGNEGLARAQFSNKSFIASMEAHYRAVGRGVQVHRIYIFETRDILEKSEICKAHLAEIQRKGMDARVIILDEKAFEDAIRMPHDFVIFGKKKVSVGRVGPNSRVDGADVYADSENIERYSIEYEKLRRLSAGASEFLGESEK